MGKILTAPVDKWTGSHPVLVAKLKAIHQAMALIGHPMIITDGVRTAAQQHELWRQGRERPGPIVTKADGFTNRSNHQPHDDGLGHAIDSCFLVAGKADWADKTPEQQARWTAFGALVKASGLAWGGDWKSPFDQPHAELKNVHTLARTIVAHPDLRVGDYDGEVA